MKWMSRAFGSKELPLQLRSALESDGIVVFGPISGSVARRSYRTALHYASSSWTDIAAGTVAMSKRRLVVWGNREALVDVPLGHPAVTMELQGSERMLVEADNFGIDRSRTGWTTLLLRTIHAPRIEQLYSENRDDRA
ncbi:hypothetical protein NDR87_09175 [Nocardia sp. CDC159]|uniref:Uncharacterized protein n=1 Tax=Nocardia pulmonis TaxID=2951408 RepID=A0A9X2E3P9_9NOCA|nr:MULTISPECIES: hypothetical protein [Nocardia]MCM6773639.1 hypothetical protein [Nocardia pulmonis]MCM6786526.1 hypothetical protein [Nocardia sp. CDC159]